MIQIDSIVKIKKVQYVHFIIVGNGILMDLIVNWMHETISINDINFTV